MHIVKSVGVMSVAKIMGCFHACMGLIFVPVFLLMGFLSMFASQRQNPFGAFGIFFAILAPVLYGIFGFIMGAIGAFLYNLLAGAVGGFELELDPQPPGPVAPYPMIPPPTPASNP